MKPAKRILDRVAAGQLTTGVLVTEQLFGQMVDYFQRVGLDYMIIDCEHGAYPDDLIVDVCTLGRMTDFAVLLRPIDCEYATIRRAIDRGPCGFLLPNVGSAADLDRVRDAIYMPPRGSRRPGGLGNLLSEIDDDRTLVSELYLRSLAREPTTDELRTCLMCVRDAGRREEAFEDILWSLINSTEFLQRR